MSLQFAFDLIRFIPLLLVIGYAAKSDFKCGSVRNRIWLYFPMGLALSVIYTVCFFSWGLLLMELFSFGFAATMGLLLMVLHGWGGADMKAFIVIGASTPLFPIWGMLYPLPFPFGMLPFLVLFVSCAASVAYAIIKKNGEPFKERKVRFLPFMLAGLIVAFIL